jgi:hypothetical protein
MRRRETKTFPKSTYALVMPEYPVRVKTKLRLPKQKRALACTSANVFSAGYSAQWARPKGHESVAVRDKRFDLESFSPDTGWKPMLLCSSERQAMFQSHPAGFLIEPTATTRRRNVA